MHENTPTSSPVPVLTLSASPAPLLTEPVALHNAAEVMAGVAIQPPSADIRSIIEGILFYGVFGLGIAFPLFAFVWVWITS